MRQKIKEYLIEEKKKLDNKEVDELVLKGVYPAIIEEVFGDFEDCPDFNGWQGDYWAKTTDYSIFGCMYYGTAEINRKEN